MIIRAIRFFIYQFQIISFFNWVIPNRTFFIFIELFNIYSRNFKLILLINDTSFIRILTCSWRCSLPYFSFNRWGWLLLLFYSRVFNIFTWILSFYRCCRLGINFRYFELLLLLIMLSQGYFHSFFNLFPMLLSSICGDANISVQFNFRCWFCLTGEILLRLSHIFAISFASRN